MDAREQLESAPGFSFVFTNQFPRETREYLSVDVGGNPRNVRVVQLKSASGMLFVGKFHEDVRRRYRLLVILLCRECEVQRMYKEY